MSDTEHRLEAALRRMERMEKQIEELKRSKAMSKSVKQVNDRGGLIVNRRTGKGVVVLPPEKTIPARSKRGQFWQHVAYNQ